jgi:transcriptional regulator with XRE-family HTH domain
MYPARLARQRAGISLPAAAKRCGIGERYLASCERTGQFSYGLATRLARLYGVGLEAFLPHRASSRPDSAMGVGRSRNRSAPAGDVNGEIHD